MMFYNFTTTTHAKWILAGEHAVLRGHGALVFPLSTHQLILTYLPEDAELSADFSGSHGSDMHLLFWSVLQEGYRLINDSINRLNGHFFIENTIPVGVGMGASAALCVAMARWFAAQQLIPSDTIHDFAKRLEHLFHGQSSGLDIAGVASDSGIYFQQGKTQAIQQAWSPHWYLSSSAQLGVTSHCINQVQALWESNPVEAKQIDEAMNHAVNQARYALENNHSDSIPLLIDAVKEAGHCFERWHLISENLSQHIQRLYQLGAVAVKPTGSGHGGFVLSIWPESLDNRISEIPFELIKVS